MHFVIDDDGAHLPLIMCAGIVLLTTAFGLASPQVDAVHSPDQVPLLLRIVPR